MIESAALERQLTQQSPWPSHVPDVRALRAGEQLPSKLKHKQRAEAAAAAGSGFPMWEIDHTFSRKKANPWNADDSEQQLEGFASSVTADHAQCPPSFASLPPLSLTAEGGKGESEIPWMVSKCSWLAPVTRIHSIIPMPRPAPSPPSSPSSCLPVHPLLSS